MFRCRLCGNVLKGKDIKAGRHEDGKCPKALRRCKNCGSLERAEKQAKHLICQSTKSSGGQHDYGEVA